MTLLLSLALCAPDVLAATPDAAAEAPAATVEATDPPASGPDRSGPPQVLAPVPKQLEDLTLHTLSTGLPVYHLRVPRLRKAHLQLTWWKGKHELGVEPSAAKAFDALWGYASERFDATELAEFESRYDAEVIGDLGQHEATVDLRVPLEHLEQGVELLAEVALRPVFTKRDVKLDQEETERWFLTQAPQSPSWIASSAMEYGWMPAEHPYGRRFDLDAYLRLKAKQVATVHQALLATGPVSLLVVADVDFEVLRPLLEAQLVGLKTDGERAQPLPVQVTAADRVIAIDMPDSEQALIRARVAAPTRDDPQRVLLDASTWALSGHFLSRFNRNLREDKGWTYGVRGSYYPARTYGYYSVGVDVPVEHFGAAVGELEAELTAVLDEGVTDDELESWWRASVKDFNDSWGTVDAAVGTYAPLLRHDEKIADQVARLDAADAVTIDAAREAAERWLGTDRPRLWVVVGPRAALEGPLEELGWSAEWLTPEQAVFGRFAGGALAD